MAATAAMETWVDQSDTNIFERGVLFPIFLGEWQKTRKPGGMEIRFRGNFELFRQHDNPLCLRKENLDNHAGVRSTAFLVFYGRKFTRWDTWLGARLRDRQKRSFCTFTLLRNPILYLAENAGILIVTTVLLLV